jgi:D-3-phosphoglycerate dehydrogenase
LASAVLDVHEPAILSGGEAIFDTPNTLLTPHLAGITATSLTGMSQWAVDTMLALLNGERPSNVVKNQNK